MKAYRINDWGSPGVEEIPMPLPGAGEVRIRVHSASIGFGDALLTSGKYQVKPDLPFTAGVECSGWIDAIGPRVRGYAIGDRVIGVGLIGNSRVERRVPGAIAEQVVYPVANVSPVPQGLDMEQASFFRSTNETSWFGLKQAKLRRGESLLVLGAGGGTGFAAVALGKLVGARVIASASTQARRDEAMRAGADAVVGRDDPDWRQRIIELTGGRGVDVVYDPIGGDATEQAFRTLANGGRLVVIGFASGDIARLPVNLALLKNASLIGANQDLARHRDFAAFRRRARELAHFCEQGLLPLPTIARRYPLAQAAEAMAAVLAGEADGRTIIRIG